MGITGLLKDLEKSRTAGCLLEDLVGQRVAIDASDWIYKAICVPYDAFNPEQYLFGRLINLLLCNIKPILVFDGQELPAKKQVSEHRKAKKAKMLIEAEILMSEGKVKEAAHMRRMAGEGTGKLTEAMKKLCTTYKIPYVQSPLEADAQIAHLVKQNLVDFVISNDSDMIVYACEKVLYKLANGKGQLYDQGQIEQSWGTPYDGETFRAVAILTGCDYLKGGLPGFGIKSARKLYSKLSQPFDFQQMINLVTLQVPPGFEQKFMDAVNVFKYQLVFDVISKTIQPLTPYPKGKTAHDYPGAGDPSIVLGEYYDAGGENCSLPIWVVSQGSTRSKRLYFCTVCLKCFSSHQNRSVHMLTSLHNRWICNHCGKSFTQKSNLTAHVRVHTGEKPYGCEFCGKAFTCKSHLKRHVRTHTGEKPYVCDICEKRFITSYDLTTHMRSHTGHTPYVCDICGKGFTQKSNLTRHHRKHKPLPQSEPESEAVPSTSGGSRGIGRSGMALGVDGSGATEPSEEAGKEGTLRKLSLSSASTRAGSPDVLTPTRARLQKLDQNSSKILEKPIEYVFCQERFKQKPNLTRHVRTRTGEKPCVCDTCGKTFTNKSHLTRHVQLHTGEKPYVCEICGKTFTQKPNLTAHVRIHTGEKPCVCKICGLPFTNKSNLTRHVQIHTGEKPFECDICGNGYNRKTNLTRHQCKQHKPLPQSEPEYEAIPSTSGGSRDIVRSGMAMGVDGSGATEPSEEAGKEGSRRKLSLSSASTSAGSPDVLTPTRARLQKQDQNNSKRESRSSVKKRSCSSKALGQQMQKPENVENEK